MGSLLKRGYILHRDSNAQIPCDIVAAEGGDWLGWYVIRQSDGSLGLLYAEHLHKLEERMHTAEYMKGKREIDGFVQSGIIFLPRIKNFS